jgi:hypothetical protein
MVNLVATGRMGRHHPDRSYQRARGTLTLDSMITMGSSSSSSMIGRRSSSSSSSTAALGIQRGQTAADQQQPMHKHRHKCMRAVKQWLLLRRRRQGLVALLELSRRGSSTHIQLNKVGSSHSQAQMPRQTPLHRPQVYSRRQWLVACRHPCLHQRQVAVLLLGGKPRGLSRCLRILSLRTC